MFPLPRGAVSWFFVLISFMLVIKAGSTTEARIVCYYTNWSVYRPGTAKFNPQNINPYLCTHLIYAFGGFTKDNTLKPFDKYQDIEQGGYAKFTGLKTYNRDLKTMLAIGGWNEGSSRFSPLVASPERRAQFTKNVIKFLRQNHFDGLDLDWEYPAFRDGGKSRDRDNYAQFVQELREDFDRESSKTGRPRLILTMAVPAGLEYVEKGYDVEKLNKYLDWFNLLTYDYHSAYEPAVNHHAPLYPLEEENEYSFDSDLNIDQTIKYYLNAGADRDKLVLGIPTYGRSYTLFNSDATDIGSPADGPGDQGDATREKGYLAYYEICHNVKDDDEWTVEQPNPKSVGPYAYKDNQWVGYDDEAIARVKAEYVAANGLGGIMFWSIDNDDFRGLCTGKPYPIIEAAKEALLDRIGQSDNDIAPRAKPTKASRSRSRNGSSSRNRINSSTKNENTDDDEVISVRKQITTTTTPSSRKSNSPRRRGTTTTTTQKPSRSANQSVRTTPAPPTTPDPGSDFKCEDEGFFPHPRDCKKYFWCLDSAALGIVAHQFTCPAGLFFNKQSDSCDYSRNVVCAKPKPIEIPPPTAAPITTTPSTTTQSSRPKITVATSKNTFFRTTTAAPTTPESAEYDYEEEEEDEKQATAELTKDIEDPKVIKELIDLIKKFGGLDELEKQLKIQENGVLAVQDPKSKEISTTPATSISKSLYEKVLSRTPSKLGAPNNRYSQIFNRKQDKTTDEAVSEEATEASPVVRQNAGTKYSSVIRNSRPNAQNAGLEKLPEFENVPKERKYVTIQRTRPTTSSSLTDDDDNEDGLLPLNGADDEEDEDEIRYSRAPPNRESQSVYTTPQPHYVTIRRSRPSTEATSPAPEESSEEEDDEVEEEPVTRRVSTNTPGQQYSSISRRRPTTTATTPATITTVARSTTPATPDIPVTEPLISVVTQNRYKLFERTRPTATSRITTTLASADVIISETDVADTDTNAEGVTTGSNGVTTTPSLPSHTQTRTRSTTTTDTPIIETTARNYANIARRRTTATTITNNPNDNLEATTTTAIPHTKPTTRTTRTTTEQITTTTTPIIIRTTTTKQPTTEIPILSRLDENVETETETVLGFDHKEEVTVASTVAQKTLDDILVVSSTTTTTTDPSFSNVLISSGSTNRNTIDIEKSNVNEATTTRVTDTTTYLANEIEEVSNDSVTTIATPAVTEVVTTPRTTQAPLSLTTSFSRRTTTRTPTTATTEAGDVETSSPLVLSSPRPFGFSNRRTRPTIVRRVTTSATTTTTESSRPIASSKVPSSDKNNEIPSKVKPQFRPNFRRPSVTSYTRRATSTPATPQQTGISETTESFNGVSSYVRRTRPTTIPRFTTTQSSSAVDTAASSSSDRDNHHGRNTTIKSTPKIVIRRKFGARPTVAATGITTSSNGGENHQRRQFTTTTTSTPDSDSTDPPRTSNPLFRRKYQPSIRKPITTVTTTVIPEITTTPNPLGNDDQEAGQSIVSDSKYANHRYNQIGETLSFDEDVGEALQAISKAPIPYAPIVSTTTRYSSPGTEANINDKVDVVVIRRPSTRRMLDLTTSKKRLVERRPLKTTTIPPQPITEQVSRPQKLRSRKPKPFEKIAPHVANEFSPAAGGHTYRPVVDYDYYDDGDTRVVPKTAAQVKVVLHGPGIIECLDQGNFPHPLSCRKFISCAKMETGGVVGWEYTCPKGLSYDPVGGICNWAAGLGCKE